MNKYALILPVAALFGASQAQAQAIGISPRVEVKVGYNELDAEVRLDDSAQIERGSESAIGFGIEAGVDANIAESGLIGVYAGYDFPNISECGELFGDDEFCVRNKRNLVLGVRGGVNVADDGLIFVKGGYSSTRIRLSYDDGGEVFDESDSVSGWHIGAGVELSVDKGIYVKGEYVHTRYKDVLKDSLAPTDSIDPSRHQIMAGVGYRFGPLSQ